MKKVIIHPEQTQTISIDSITNDSIVGIIWVEGDKSWIIETHIGEYKGISVGEETTLGLWTKKSKKAYCTDAIEMKAEVFVFDTEAELVKWLKS